MKKYLFLGTIMLVIYFLAVKYNQADWDLWARLAVGAIFFQTGTVLKHDIFAYTQTKALWIDHEWGSGVIFYFLAHNFGDIGLVLLKVFILLGIFLFIFKTNQIRSNDKNPYRLFYYILILWALIPAFHVTLRSQSFTYLFFAMWLYLLDRVRLGNNKLIWLFPASMLIWANVHGGFLAGLGILAVYGIGEALNKRSFLKYFGILALSGAVTLINPYGLKYWTYIIDAVTMPRPYVNEWSSLNLFGPVGELVGFKIFVILTVLSLIFIFIKRYKSINWAEILIIAATFYMGISHRRHIIFFIIASSSYIYYYLYPAIDWYTRNLLEKFYSIFPPLMRKLSRRIREGIIYGLLLFFGLSVILIAPPKVIINQNEFPTKAIKFIQVNHLSGNLLVLFNWGSYALWKLYPQCKIAIDGRYEEVYTDELVNDTVRFQYAGQNWQGLINKYKTDAILVPLDYDVYKKLIFLDGWKIIYKDKVAAIFVPKSKSNKKWIQVSDKYDANKEKYDSSISYSLKTT